MRTYSSSSGESPLCWRFTNWTSSGGDLENSVTFESSSDPQETVDSSSMSTPLVLKPLVPESGPCEIQLSFSQKYEIRQIYVRSTARVYEIYYSKSEQSSNEYLCTVRCSIAEREGEVLKAFDFGSSAKEIIQDKFVCEGNSATSEEDWVEVRAIGSEIQDLYEATAEINDSDSCASVTIRLLSLQNKGCVCIDEVYVYADPVVSNEPENQLNPLNSSTESSLMSLLVPTILQLSTSNRISQEKSQQASHHVEAQSKEADLTDNTTRKVKHMEDGLLSTDSTNDVSESVSRNQIEPKSVVNESTEQTSAIEPTVDPAQIPEEEEEDTRSGDSRVEKLLEQLLCRVTKIEEVCVRFEESMVKPMKNMEIRIQQVEQQLNLLAKDSQYSGSPNFRGFSVPSISCDSNELEKKDFTFSDLKPCGSDEFEKKDLTVSNSVNGPDLSPGLMVTTPELTSDYNQDVDDSEPIHGEKSPHDCPEQNPKRILIDDILAASLSGLLSESTSHSSEDKQQHTDLPNTDEMCGGEDHVPYSETSRAFTAPPELFTFWENGWDDYSDFQFVVPLSTSDIELEKDDISNSVPPNPLHIYKSSSSLPDLLTPMSLDYKLDSEYFFNKSIVGVDEEEMKAVLNSQPEGETFGAEIGYSFDLFKDIEAIEPLTFENLFSGTYEATDNSNNGGSNFVDPFVDSIWNLLP